MNADFNQIEVINVGSLNLDWVHRVPHFVQPGETLHAFSFDEYVGGKGLNQSIALARAGCKVAHVGAVGQNGKILLDTLMADGVNTEFVASLSGPSGHAMIQVSQTGENAIVLCPGANDQITSSQIEQALQAFKHSKAVLLQNETNALAQTMNLAKEAGKLLFYNPAPMVPFIHDLPLHLVDVLILNEIEAAAFDLDQLSQQIPNLIIVLTLGAQGVTVITQGKTQHTPAMPVEKIVDTTAAGDTFIGYFMAEYLRSQAVEQAIAWATQAASLCIQKPGAAQSIPLAELMVR